MEWKMKVCIQMVYVTTKMATMSIYGKTLKNLLLWNQKAEVGIWHRVLEYYQVCSRLTLTYFTARSNLVPYIFVWEKGKTMDFSETIVVLLLPHLSL